MTGPNLDKDIEHILVNVALNGAYEDAGQRVLSQGTIVKAKKYIDLLIANQVREARIDERSQAQQYLHGLTITPESQHLFDVLSRNNHNRIATLNGVKK